jgi:hypothetical protein
MHLAPKAPHVPNHCSGATLQLLFRRSPKVKKSSCMFSVRCRVPMPAGVWRLYVVQKRGISRSLNKLDIIHVTAT